MWLVSPFYDLAFIIFSSVLLVVPHLFATYTMTFMEPHFRERYRRYTWGALLVVSLAIINLTLLVTIFFFWASVHVIHQAAYLAVVLYLNQVRADRGLIGSQYVARVSSSGRRLYWMCFLFTLGAAAAYLLVLGANVMLGTFGGNFAEQHYFAFYSVVLSALLIHYYFDHFLFLQVDDVITPRWS